MPRTPSATSERPAMRGEPDDGARQTRANPPGPSKRGLPAQAELSVNRSANMVELTTAKPRLAGAHERRARADALRRHREEVRARGAGAAGELSYLRAQLHVAATLTTRLAAAREPREMAKQVVDELHDCFSFYLAAIQSLHDDGTLRLVAARGRRAGGMEGVVLRVQPVGRGGYRPAAR